MDGIRKHILKGVESCHPLGCIVDIRKGSQINGSELLETGKYPVMNGGLTPSGYLDEYNTPANIISISEGGNSCGYVQFNRTPIWSGGHCYTLYPLNESVNYRYLYHYLKTEESNIMKLRIGSGLPNIQKKDLAKFLVTFPSLRRQAEISDSLDALETKISHEQKILDLYICQKAFLLSEMFI